MTQPVNDEEILAECRQRRKAFDKVCSQLWNDYGESYEVFNRCTCPACGYPTIEDYGRYDMCHLCAWEDDGQDDAEAEEIRGGPNGNYSLKEARLNFFRFGSMYRPDDVVSEMESERLVQKKKMKRMYENLLGVSNREKLASRVQEIKRFEGSPTTIEEYLAGKHLRYKERKGIFLEGTWLEHPVWEGTRYGQAMVTHDSALDYFHRRFNRTLALCNRLRDMAIERFDRSPCPACGLPTFERGAAECRLCGWNQKVPATTDPAMARDGLHEDSPLSQARLNFDKYLTIHNPDDEPLFSGSEANILKKCLLIRAYLKFSEEGRPAEKQINRILSLEKEALRNKE